MRSDDMLVHVCNHHRVKLDEDDLEPPAPGSVLRVMWDETAGPLWGDEGLLPEEAEWLERVLGLSKPLVADLLRWMDDMTNLHLGSSAERQRVDQAELSAQGLALADSVQLEVGARYLVRYRG